MILGFSTKFPKGKGILSEVRTFFPERIIRSLDVTEVRKMTLCDLLYETKDESDWLPITEFQALNPKKHTIREDMTNRWRLGLYIDFFIGVRTKNMLRFAPKVGVKSIQRISIYKVARVSTPHTIKVNGKTYQVEVDGNCLLEDQIVKLSENDGFDSVTEFFEWFNEDFTGKIIHWTDLKY